MRFFRFMTGLLMAALLFAIVVPIVAFAQAVPVASVVGIGGVVDQLCSDKSGITGLLAYALYTIGGASILANFRRILPVPLATIVDFLAANWFRIFEFLSRSTLDAKPPATRTAPMIALFILAGSLALYGCTGDPTKDAATVQGYLVAYQPLASELACTAQKGANLAGDAAAANGDASGAQVSSLFSQGNGLFCNGLPAGAALPAPVVSPLPAAALGVAPKT
jgi:hypothetical protein